MIDVREEKELCSGTYFSQRFRAVRLSRGIDFNTLIRRTGFSNTTIYRYEKGTSIPRNIGTWELLAKAHDLSLAEYMNALFGIKKEQVQGLEGWAEEVLSIAKKCPLIGSMSGKEGTG